MRMPGPRLAPKSGMVGLGDGAAGGVIAASDRDETRGAGREGGRCLPAGSGVGAHERPQQVAEGGGVERGYVAAALDGPELHVDAARTTAIGRHVGLAAGQRRNQIQRGARVSQHPAAAVLLCPGLDGLRRRRVRPRQGASAAVRDGRILVAMNFEHRDRVRRRTAIGVVPDRARDADDSSQPRREIATQAVRHVAAVRGPDDEDAPGIDVYLAATSSSTAPR